MCGWDSFIYLFVVFIHLEDMKPLAQVRAICKLFATYEEVAPTLSLLLPWVLVVEADPGEGALVAFERCEITCCRTLSV